MTDVGLKMLMIGKSLFVLIPLYPYFKMFPKKWTKTVICSYAPDVDVCFVLQQNKY